MDTHYTQHVTHYKHTHTHTHTHTRPRTHTYTQLNTHIVTHTGATHTQYTHTRDVFLEDIMCGYIGPLLSKAFPWPPGPRSVQILSLASEVCPWPFFEARAAERGGRGALAPPKISNTRKVRLLTKVKSALFLACTKMPPG